MANKFEIKLIVPAKLVGTIIELLNDEGILVECRPYHVERKGNIHRHHVPGMTADQLMMAFIEATNKPFATKDVEKIFKEQGYAIGTVSSRLSMAKAKKLIRSVGSPRSGLYERVKS